MFFTNVATFRPWVNLLQVTNGVKIVQTNPFYSYELYVYKVRENNKYTL